MKKKIVFSLMAITSLMLMIFSGCDFRNNEQTEFESGDFIYTYVNRAGANGKLGKGKYVAILELSEEGKKKDVIIIPEEINNKSIIQLGMGGFMWRTEIYNESGNLTLYLPKTILSIGEVYAKIFLIEEAAECFYNKISTNSNSIYVSSYIYEKYYSKSECPYLHIANIEYVVDEETYWLDDYDTESLIREPKKLIKDGYEFLGWYKEMECINKWDFEKDKVPGKTVSEDGTENINLTRLYAKWQKI